MFWPTCMLSPVTVRSVHPTCVRTVKVGSQKSVDQTHRKVGLFVAEKRFFFFHEDWEWEKRAALRKEWPAARIDCPSKFRVRKSGPTRNGSTIIITLRHMHTHTHTLTYSRTALNFE